MKTKEFKYIGGKMASLVCIIFLLSNPISLFGEDYGNEVVEDASSSFTMRVCGTLERQPTQLNERPTFFVQDGKTDIKFLMEGLVSDDKSADHFYMEGRYLPDSTYCNIKSVKTPDAIPLGEKHCWYTVYDKSKKLIVLYMDSEDMCGDAQSICEVSRTSTKMDDMCLMLEDMGRVDHDKLEKEVQADEGSVAGSITLVAERPLSEREIQNNYNTFLGKNASVVESEKMKFAQTESMER